MTTLAQALRYGTHAARPAPSAAMESFRYWETDTSTEWMVQNGTWVQVSSLFGPDVDISPASTVVASAPGDASVVGVDLTYAREDHKHGRETFGAAGDIGAETFGASAAAGATGKVADAGHIHSLPTVTAGAMTRIAQTILGASAASFDFSAIPATYTDLILTGALKSDSAGGADTCIVSFNGDLIGGSSLYSYQYIMSNNGSVSGAIGQSFPTNNAILEVGATGGSPSLFGAVDLQFTLYAGSLIPKLVKFRSVVFTTTGSGASLSQDGWLMYDSASAISRITIAPKNGTHWVAGSELTLWGRT